MKQTINVNVSLDYDDSEIKRAAKKDYNLKLESYEIIERSLDARRSILKFNLKLLVDFDFEIKGCGKYREKYKPKELPKNKIKVGIVGFGPAGIYAAHILNLAGFNVDVYERGSDVDKRKEDVFKFIESRILNPESNISFGEGGAGTFSDAKITKI